MDQEIVVDCPECGVRIAAPSRGCVMEPQVGDMGFHLLECPSCKGPIFAQAWLHQHDVDEHSWGDVERLWPQPAKRVMSDAVPRLAAKDMEDAQRCLHHGIYSAAAVLCGRALERLVREKTSEKTISKGLALLRDQGVIDSKLFDWANALRHERNLGAHASDHEVTPENAEDVVDFTYAIFEYVYTLTSKFDDFMKRKKANQIITENSGASPLGV